MKITALEYAPTCGAMIRLDDEGGAGSLILVCTLEQDHHQDHEDDAGNTWHLEYDKIPNGVAERVAFTWGGRTALPGGVGWSR